MFVKRWQALTAVSSFLFFSSVHYSKFETNFFSDSKNVSSSLNIIPTQSTSELRDRKSPEATPFSNISYVNATFFIEVRGKPDLSCRQICAVEAAVTAHSDYPVIVYMTGFNGTLSPWMETSPNLYVRKLNLDELILNTHLENVYADKNFRDSPIVEHVSDLSRIALLKQHGGLYMDIDMILMKPALNFGSFMVKNQGNGVLRFDEASPLLVKVYELLGNIKYNRDDYNLLGAKIIKKAVKEVCYSNDCALDYEKAGEICYINFVDNELFSPVPWFEFKKLFTRNINLDNFRPKVVKKAVAFHFAGHVTNSIPVFKNGSSLFNEIAKKYCPKIYRSFPDIY
ncbi:lactosylceramide 4-alpha-galactosyltransferase-like [Artemia franciscana]|uniref:Alpha 1,4-glycosyltransferase domain-containing protein n=1 Tax=Artemia franciscana TaxID=6661 RepID=A0AA88L4X4_ARTSF|nr:hypothetical protein QYM36_011643 [Artemia franciscana]